MNINMDSRKIVKGEVFIALKGELRDGHDYIDDAFRNGASSAIVEREWLEKTGNPCGYNIEAVDDVLRHVQTLARDRRRQLRVPVVAVTGSNGKTSTSFALKEILGRKLKVGGTKGNFNNHIGVPLSILAMDGGEDIAVFEVGANHAGEIAELTTIIEPDIGIITNIGYAHVGLFGGIEKTAEAKFELARAVSFKKGTMLLNGDDKMTVYQNAIDRVSAVYFGVGDGNQIRAKNIACGEDGCYSFEFNDDRYELSMQGYHAIYTVLPAIYLALSMGIDKNTVKDAVMELKPANMRGEIEVLEKIKIIKDCYNANPSSMQTALKMFSDIPVSARRIAMLGTMGELGEYEEKLHKELGASLKDYKVDLLIAVGSRAETIADGALSTGFNKDKIFSAATAQEAGDVALKILREDDAILFKGSRNIELEKAISVLYNNL